MFDLLRDFQLSRQILIPVGTAIALAGMSAGAAQANDFDSLSANTVHDLEIAKTGARTYQLQQRQTANPFQIVVNLGEKKITIGSETKTFADIQKTSGGKAFVSTMVSFDYKVTATLKSFENRGKTPDATQTKMPPAPKARPAAPAQAAPAVVPPAEPAPTSTAPAPTPAPAPVTAPQAAPAPTPASMSQAPATAAPTRLTPAPAAPAANVQQKAAPAVPPLLPQLQTRTSDRGVIVPERAARKNPGPDAYPDREEAPPQIAQGASIDVKQMAAAAMTAPPRVIAPTTAETAQAADATRANDFVISRAQAASNDNMSPIQQVLRNGGATAAPLSANTSGPSIYMTGAAATLLVAGFLAYRIWFSHAPAPASPRPSPQAWRGLPLLRKNTAANANQRESFKDEPLAKETPQTIQTADGFTLKILRPRTPQSGLAVGKTPAKTTFIDGARKLTKEEVLLRKQDVSAEFLLKQNMQYMDEFGGSHTADEIQTLRIIQGKLNGIINDPFLGPDTRIKLPKAVHELSIKNSATVIMAIDAAFLGKYARETLLAPVPQKVFELPSDQTSFHAQRIAAAPQVR